MPILGESDRQRRHDNRAKSRSQSRGKKGLNQVQPAFLEAIEERPSLERPSTQGPASARPSIDDLLERPSFARKSVEPAQAVAAILMMSDLNITKDLGKGSFGMASRGGYRNFEVVIKKRDMQAKFAPAQLDTFRKEIERLVAVQHAHLSKFVGVAFEADTFC